jgi:ATP-dependent helicase HrpB
MVGGRGVRLDKNSSVRHEEFFLAIDIDDSGSEVTVRAASAVEPQWLTGGSDWKKHVSVCDNLSFNQSKKRVEERRQVSWHGLILEESPRAVSNESVSLELLFQQALRKPCEVLPAANTEAGEFMVRAKWLQQTLRESKSAQAERLMNTCLDDEILIQQAKSRADGLRSFEDIRTMNWQSVFGRYLGDDMVAEVNRLAPVKCMLQDGKKYRIEYAVGKQPEVSIQIQNLFGMKHLPPIVDGEVTLLLQLLGPNNRPQQRTTDLKSFWVNTYPGVKKELKRRYPKHAWPDDPMAAVVKKKRWGKHG